VRVLRAAPAAGGAPARRPMPAWGWAGLVLLLVSWVLAWTRFEWFAPLQRHTFTPLWLGYVVLVNALAWRRSGRCMLVDRPGRLVALFALSALFWWFFEYLNRFVRNWHYVGVEGLGPWQYALEATLAFSTVLPAVVCTRDWLATYPRLHAGLDRAWRPRPPRGLAPATLAASGAVLTCIGLWPAVLYPALWLAPLGVLLSVQALLGQATVLAPVTRGDWRGVWLAALAGLACGVLWEAWNLRSLAHWEYAIPYLHRFLVFEMPLPGYAGYLPFGLACVAAAALLDRDAARASPPVRH